MTEQDMKKVLKLHGMWLRYETGGVRADLRDANLRGANLRDANLSGAATDKRYIQIACIGSAKRLTTYCVDDDVVWCGCFSGTLAEFEEQVRLTHASSPQFLAEYVGFIEYLKMLKGE